MKYRELMNLKTLSRLILPNLLSFPISSYAASISWGNEIDDNSYNVITSVDDDTMSLNYCFIFDHGGRINCNDDRELTLVKKNAHCYASEAAQNAWDGEPFYLSACFYGDELRWSTNKSLQYIPPNLVLHRISAEGVLQ